MLDATIQFQALFFAPNARLEPTAENLATLLTLFSKEGFIPTTFEEFQIGPVPNRRLGIQLITPDSGWTVAFEPNRVAVTRANTGRGAMPTAAEFIGLASSIIERLDQKYGYRGSRLAYTTKGVWRDVSLGQQQQFASHLFNLPPFYQATPPLEWMSRIVTRKTAEINGKPELVNAVTDINRVEYVMPGSADSKPFEAIEVGFDINTFQNNSALRFGAADLTDFLKFAANLASGILGEIEAYRK